MSKKCTECNEEKAEGEFTLMGRLDKSGNQARRADCKTCHCVHVKSKYPEKKEQISRRMKGAYDEDPEKFRKRSRDWRGKNKNKVKEYYKKWRDNADRFKIALQSSRRAARNGGYEPCSATVEEIRAAYTGRCEICGVSDMECISKFHMDHNHEPPGNFRGWLCARCNKALGGFGDSEELLINALHFLMKDKVK